MKILITIIHRPYDGVNVIQPKTEKSTTVVLLDLRSIIKRVEYLFECTTVLYCINYNFEVI